jgi:hypothetical protein
MHKTALRGDSVKALSNILKFGFNLCHLKLPITQTLLVFCQLSLIIRPRLV